MELLPGEYLIISPNEVHRACSNPPLCKDAELWVIQVAFHTLGRERASRYVEIQLQLWSLHCGEGCEDGSIAHAAQAMHWGVLDQEGLYVLHTTRDQYRVVKPP
jgi:hypothetical protein